MKVDWTEKQIEKNPFANNLRQHGLLLTESDVKFLQSFNFITEEEYQRRKIISLAEKYKYWIGGYKRNQSSIVYHKVLDVLIIKAIEIWNTLDDKTSINLLEFYRKELENDLKSIIKDFVNVPDDEALIEAKHEINQTLDMVNKLLKNPAP